MGAGFGIETVPVMWDAYHLDYRIEKKPGYPFLESPGNFSGPENWFVFIQYQSFNNFKNNKMKLSVIEEKLAGSWARNCATIQQVWILKFAFGIEKFKFRGFRETEIDKPYCTATVVGDSPRASVNYGFSIQSFLNLGKSFPEYLAHEKL